MEIIDLQEFHINSALALSEEANWNQTKADWSMMIAAGRAIGIQCPQNNIIASALTLPYGPDFGWISMVLVSQNWQKNGLATRLLTTCIKILEDSGRTPILDATPAGENVYLPLGFKPHFAFTRWENNAVENLALVSHLQVPLIPVDTQSVLEIDAAYFGCDRKPVLEHLIKRSSEFSCMAQSGTGYLLGREGRNATQIGPILAAESATALALLDAALSNLSGPVFIDANNNQPEMIKRLEHYGFTKQRSFLRMAKDRSTVIGDPSKMYAMAGPELG